MFDDHSELDYAIASRLMLNVVAIGPLTLDEHESVEAYERHQLEAAEEDEAEQRAGGRTICPACGERSVTHRAVYTLGYEGHPGAELSDLASCERCEYREV